MTDDALDLSRRTVLGGLAGLAGLGAAGVSATGTTLQEDDADRPGLDYTVEVTQSEGQPVNWVLPGPRRISEEVFGTPDNPLLGDDVLQHAKEQNPEMADLLDELPIMAALPEEMRETNDDGSAYTVTSEPTPFGDDHHPVEGQLDLTYRDRAPWAGFKQARDEADIDVEFTDPADNTYSADIAMLDRRTKEHAGGVLVGGLIHGTTGIGSPLFPKMYNYASLWGVGTLDINDGEQTLENRVFHFMTTQMTRDSDYALAVDEQLPLAEPFLGGSHHTHGIFYPIRMTEDGPVHDPLDIPFPPDAEQGQPFIHIMYDLEELSITADGPPNGREGRGGDEGQGDGGDDDGRGNGGDGGDGQGDGDGGQGGGDGGQGGDGNGGGA